jgi:hypothetical protein
MVLQIGKNCASVRTPYFPAGSARAGRKPVADPVRKKESASQQRKAREISRSHQTAFRSSSTLSGERSRADRAGLRGAGDIVAALAEPLVKCQPALNRCLLRSTEWASSLAVAGTMHGEAIPPKSV